MSLAALIATQRAEHGIPVAVSCRALGLSQAWFHKWRKGDRSPRRKRRAALAATIGYLFARHNGTYGSPRITADLRALGWRVSENTVAKLMAEQDLLARRKRRRPAPPTISRRPTEEPAPSSWQQPTGLHIQSMQPRSLPRGRSGSSPRPRPRTPQSRSNPDPIGASMSRISFDRPVSGHVKRTQLA